ncbi:MAG: prepilin-type N-terminal cleavage/methylation domain-containing protein [Rhodocyclaceae bacterium]
MRVNPEYSYAKTPSCRRAVEGFTLVEMLVAIAVIALIMAIAAPNFSHYNAATQTSAASDGLVRAAAHARALAVQSGRRTTLLINTDSTPCSGAVAWSIEQDGEAIGCLSNADFAKRYRGTTLSGSSVSIVYSPTGIANEQTSDLTFSFNAGSSTTQVRINAGGTSQVL